MAGEVPRQANMLNEGPKGVARTFIVGGSIVAGGLLSFYYAMLNRERRQEAAGRNPYYEQVTGHLTRKMPVPGDDLRPLSGPHAAYSMHPPAFPATEHNSGHITIGTFNKNHRQTKAENLTDPAAAADSVGTPIDKRDERALVPPPQRGKNDGSGKAYTKSPDYAKNYEKTREGRDRRVMPIAVNL